MHISKRIQQSLRPAGIHLAGSALAASCLAALIFFVWYPHPYDQFSGGRTLFFLLIGVDVVCGPLLTLLLYTKSKPPHLLYLDLGLIVLLQSCALAYGLHTAWMARPMYLVMEVDRFKAITRADLADEDIEKLPTELRTGIWKKPMVVGVRAPASVQEKNKVLFESTQGGKDYAERPEFYVPYSDKVASESIGRAKPLSLFLGKYPEMRDWAEKYSTANGVDIGNIKYLPIMAKSDWIAILDANGHAIYFLKGDGF